MSARFVLFLSPVLVAALSQVSGTAFAAELTLSKNVSIDGGNTYVPADAADASAPDVPAGTTVRYQLVVEHTPTSNESAIDLEIEDLLADGDITLAGAPNLTVTHSAHGDITALASVMLGSSVNVQLGSTTLLSEDFEGGPLGPFVSPSEGGGDGTDWSDVPPAGWSRDNTTTPVGGPVEFFGWTFLDANSWVATAGNQARDNFTFGTGTIAVADADEYDDLVDVDPDLYNVFLTAEVDVTGVAPNTVEVRFDSSFRPLDGMTGTLDVSFDGGSSWSNLLTLDTASTPGGDDSLARTNEAVTLAVANPVASSMLLRFGNTNAGNDWWWAIDNVEVTSVAPDLAVGEQITVEFDAVVSGSGVQTNTGTVDYQGSGGTPGIQASDDANVEVVAVEGDLLTDAIGSTAGFGTVLDSGPAQFDRGRIEQNLLDLEAVWQAMGCSTVRLAGTFARQRANRVLGLTDDGRPISGPTLLTIDIGGVAGSAGLTSGGGLVGTTAAGTEIEGTFARLSSARSIFYGVEADCSP